MACAVVGPRPFLYVPRALCRSSDMYARETRATTTMLHGGRLESSGLLHVLCSLMPAALSPKKDLCGNRFAVHDQSPMPALSFPLISPPTRPWLAVCVCVCARDVCPVG